MPNYATIIEEELRRVYDRASKLKAALEVINEFRADVRSQPEQPQIEDKGPKHKRRKLGANMYMRTKQMVLAVLNEQTEPVRGGVIQREVQSRMQVSDSTVWKCLKDLRDEGTVSWNSDLRLYELTDHQMKRTA
jgi:biotin operon repressor